ncbi:MAG TPA: DUF2189 domain-containing protein [Dongiaceae bacterium]|nr:DUF2189 domain-containing protein [Dongiaceae bacterium]
MAARMEFSMTTATPGISIRELTLHQPWQWLEKGWQDFKRAPAVGAAHGVAVAIFAALLVLVAHNKFWLLAGAFTGFLVVAPVLAVGLYGVSRALEQGHPVGFMTVWRTWMSWRGRPHHDWRLVRFSLLLGLAGTGWVLTSAALITLLAPVPINQPLDFLRHVVIARDNYLFEVWLALGGALAAPMFASSVVTLPLLLDRRINVLDAVLVSWRAVMANPAPMALWAALIMGLALLGLLGFVMGCAVVIPVLGHASWHVYRDSVDASALPLREDPVSQKGG